MMKSISPRSVKKNLLEADPVSTVVGRLFPEVKVDPCWIQKTQDLLVVDEDIGVAAFAVTDLEHHRRAAAERPTEL
jgi:hypothetical protein